jgi:hypothetical protein
MLDVDRENRARCPRYIVAPCKAHQRFLAPNEIAALVLLSAAASRVFSPRHTHSFAVAGHDHEHGA